MLKRSHYIALGLVVLVTLTILNLPDRTATRLKLGIGSLFLPLFGLAGSAQDMADQAGDNVATRRELVRQNEALRRETAQLKLQLAEARQVDEENARLRQYLGWQRQQHGKYRLASVVLREPANWWRAVQIDLGSRDGIKVNQPVLTTEGLIGRVASVSLTRSQVVLLGDPTCKVAARVDNESRDTGVIGPAGPLETGFVELGYLARNANLKPGQIVRSSGEGGIFPKDLLIGTVVDSRAVDYGLYTIARVKLAANLSSLHEAWVLLEP